MYCKLCDVAYIDPRPESSQLSIIYPKHYNAINFHKMKNPFIKYGRRFIQRKKVSSLRKYIKNKSKILDVGCGSGSLLLILKKEFGKSVDLYGNDFDQNSLNFLKNKGINTINGRFEDIEINENSFDIIILNQVIEHLEDINKVIEKAHSLLKKNGVFFIETPCMKGLDYKIFKNKYWGGWHYPRHWTIFSDNSLKKIIECKSFRLKEKKFLASPSFWIQSFHHYFFDRSFYKLANFFTIKNPLNLILFTLIDIIFSKFAFTSNMRMVFIKE